MTEDVKSEGHTPTPWKRDNRRFADYGMVHISGGHYIVAHALGQMPSCETEAEANARLIVTAVNERSALLKCEEALRKLADHLDARIDDAPGTAKPVFNGLAEVRAALTLLDEARR